LPSNNAWHHIAIVRSSGTVTVYVDGTSVGSVSDTNNYSVTQFRVGYSGVNVVPTNGFIDELRFSNTARWTSNFTPPSSAYTITNINTQEDPSGNDWLTSVTGTGTGACTAAISASLPVEAICTCTAISSTIGAGCQATTSGSTSSVGFKTYTGGTTAATLPINIVCN
jgi:hypothetical protein